MSGAHERYDVVGRDAHAVKAGRKIKDGEECRIASAREEKRKDIRRLKRLDADACCWRKLEKPFDDGHAEGVGGVFACADTEGSDDVLRVEFARPFERASFDEDGSGRAGIALRCGSREHRPKEIDFIEVRDQQMEAFECKLSPKSQANPGEAFRQSYPDCPIHEVTPQNALNFFGMEYSEK